MIVAAEAALTSFTAWINGNGAAELGQFDHAMLFTGYGCYSVTYNH